VTTGGRIQIRLHPPSPNPLTSEASISYDVPDCSGSVELTVYNVRGQRVRSLVDSPLASGRHVTSWDGTDGSGSRASAGVYFIRLEVAGETAAQKILVTR
jgi:flagellar hook assembly protein FlgD